MISQQQLSLLWSLTPNQLGHQVMCWMGDLSSELQSHSIDSRNYPSPKSELVHERKFIWKSTTLHKATWPNWLGVRLQSSDDCCWEIKSPFLVNLFFHNILSDRSSVRFSVRFAYREKPDCEPLNSNWSKKWECIVEFLFFSYKRLSTGRTRLIRSHSSARFYFELSGNSNYKIHCNSNYVQNFELEINSI